MKLDGIELDLKEICRVCNVNRYSVFASAKKQGLTVKEFLEPKFSKEKYLKLKTEEKIIRKWYYGV